MKLEIVNAVKAGFDAIRTIAIVIGVYMVVSIVDDVGDIKGDVLALKETVVNIGNGIASDEFADKSEKATNTVINIKRGFVEKWQDKTTEKE